MAKKLSGGAGWSLGPPSDAPDPANAQPPANLVAGGAKRLFVRLEKRPKGKLATVAGGPPLAPEDWARLTRTLKASCGAGGRAFDDGLELQGDRVERVRAALTALGHRL